MNNLNIQNKYNIAQFLDYKSILKIKEYDNDFFDLLTQDELLKKYLLVGQYHFEIYYKDLSNLYNYYQMDKGVNMTSKVDNYNINKNSIHMFYKVRTLYNRKAFIGVYFDNLDEDLMSTIDNMGNRRLLETRRFMDNILRHHFSVRNVIQFLELYDTKYKKKNYRN